LGINASGHTVEVRDEDEQTTTKGVLPGGVNQTTRVNKGAVKGLESGFVGVQDKRLNSPKYMSSLNMQLA